MGVLNFPRDLLPHQRDYLQALGLPEAIFTVPVNHYKGRKRAKLIN